MKHTPGPWRVEIASEFDTTYFIHSNNTWVGQVDLGDSPNEANARLIAAAPELLETLKNLSDACLSSENGNLEGYEQTFRLYVSDALKAIAKATGGAE